MNLENIGKKLCKCGCKKEVTKNKNDFLMGHWVRLNNPMKNPEIREKLSKSHKKLIKQGKLIPPYKFLTEKQKLKSIKVRRKMWKEGKLTSPMKGKKFSEETKAKMRISHKGRQDGEKNPMWGKSLSKEHKEKLSKLLKIKHRGKGNPFYGKKHSEETRQKISNKVKGRFGDRSPAWKGGISFEPYSPKFNDKLKEQIRKRDSYRCQQCFRHQDELRTISNRKYKLHIHHIDYNKKNNIPNNLISLCRNCHMQTNFKREDWVEYFQNKLEEIS